MWEIFSAMCMPNARVFNNGVWRAWYFDAHEQSEVMACQELNIFATKNKEGGRKANKRKQKENKKKIKEKKTKQKEKSVDLVGSYPLVGSCPQSSMHFGVPVIAQHLTSCVGL